MTLRASQRTSRGLSIGLSVLLALLGCQTVTGLLASPTPPPTSTPRPTRTPEPVANYRACLVTDVGGIDDRSFNQIAWQGIEAAIADFGIEGAFLDSRQQADYVPNINAFIQEGCDLIVTVGFLLGDATHDAADANPEQQFIITDYPNIDPPRRNLVGLLFSVDQAAFLAGYLAADTSQSGVVAMFGGIPIPPVTAFMDGFWYGVQYYNQRTGTDVEVLGWDPATQEGLFTGNFESMEDGRAFAAVLMDEGADVIMPVAGPLGLGSAAEIQERGDAWIIWIDTDLTLYAPEFAGITLTSVLKNMDIAVTTMIESDLNGDFPGGTNYFGTLENRGVGIAGFESLPPLMQSELSEIIEGIIAGAIQTAP